MIKLESLIPFFLEYTRAFHENIVVTVQFQLITRMFYFSTYPYKCTHPIVINK